MIVFRPVFRGVDDPSGYQGADPVLRGAGARASLGDLLSSFRDENIQVFDFPGRRRSDPVFRGVDDPQECQLGAGHGNRIVGPPHDVKGVHPTVDVGTAPASLMRW